MTEQHLLILLAIIGALNSIGIAVTGWLIAAVRRRFEMIDRRQTQIEDRVRASEIDIARLVEARVRHDYEFVHIGDKLDKLLTKIDNHGEIIRSLYEKYELPLKKGHQA